MEREHPQIFISYAGHDAFEADLLQYAVETLPKNMNAKAWTFQRDQNLTEREIAESLLDAIRKSDVLFFLVSPYTIE